ncbi:Nucleotide-binding universal stress protein, UspA family [Streptomyces sp. yr375]|uniref:universal stress protein n=1 Tax=Streptomyces sp. yr375 TaxID=1761906 RepID=UPI0008BC80C1|nr:universal stress protein [Streptomyces sp. yr375]SER63062.1 Nucleotide-binding universal stress protein, UspA family [Streptomyces sp. yr375]
MERVIITGVDRSPRSRVAADWAAREALRRGLPLRVVHVAPPENLDPVEHWPYRPDIVADHVLAELTARHPSLTIRAVSVTGAPVPELRAASAHAELVVLGLRGEGQHARTPLGSTAAALATGCAGPLVLVPGTLAGLGVSGHTDAVTVGVDARNPAVGALGFAFEAARLRRVRLHAVHAWALPAGADASPVFVSETDRATWEDHEEDLLSDALRPWRGKYPDVDVQEDVLLFPPAEALAHASETSGLVVIGRHTAPGATAQALLKHAHCPVAVVPS